MSISESEKTKDKNVRGAMICLAHIDAGLVSAMDAAVGSRSGLLELLGEPGLIAEAGMVISFVDVSVFASVIRGDGLP